MTDPSCPKDETERRSVLRGTSRVVEPSRPVPDEARRILHVASGNALPPGPADLSALLDLGLTLQRELESFGAESFDPLTGLTNRAGLLALGAEMIDVSRSASEGAALLYVCRDDAKALDDRLDREADDHALRELARLLEGNVRASDLVARVGEDEFCVVMAPYTDESEDFGVADRVQRAIEAFNETSGAPWALGVHIGGALYRPGMEFEALLALAEARSHGRVRRR
jgi:diguanylate cyclase (GGDEF)-like protein